MNPDSPWLRAAFVLASGVLVHEGVLRGLRIGGIRPDLLLALGIVAAIVGTPEGGAILAFAAGLAGDLFVNTPFGLSALVASVVAYAAGSIQQGLGAHHRWSVPVLTGAASAAAVTAWAGLGTVLGIPGLLRPHLLLVVFVVSVGNIVFSIPLTPMARWVFAGLPGAVSNAGPGSGSRGFLA
ncbi:MAG: hypothetical protein NVSMB12_19830 [Acidimicrobiales bacterium]